MMIKVIPCIWVNLYNRTHLYQAGVVSCRGAGKLSDALVRHLLSKRVSDARRLLIS